ncbi:MAG: RHS repeat-associated core domain-containing protein [Bacteroidales bacterium]
MYDAFGQIVQQNELIPQPYKFTGREYDPFTDFYYYRARYYDAELGRYLTKDPAGMVNGPNIYLYVLSNPVNMTDPSGLDWELPEIVKPNPGPNGMPGISLKFGGPGNYIVRNTTLGAHRYPDFEMDLTIAYITKSGNFYTKKNLQMYMDQEAKKCYTSWTQYVTHDEYINYFSFYLAIYLKLNVDRKAIEKAKEDAKAGADAATAGTVIGVASTAGGFIPGIGPFISIAGGAAGLAAGAISENHYKNAIDKLIGAVKGANASIDHYFYTWKYWSEFLKTVDELPEDRYEETGCPQYDYDKTGGDCNDRGHHPIRPKPVITPGPGNYKPPNAGKPSNSGFNPNPWGFPDDGTFWDPGRWTFPDDGILWDPVPFDFDDGILWHPRPLSEYPDHILWNPVLPNDLDGNIWWDPAIPYFNPDNIWEAESNKKYYVRPMYKLPK